MTFNSIEQIDAFTNAIHKCEGNVWLESKYGDKFNLKSDLSVYIALGKMLSEKFNDLELYCSNKEDERYFLKFFNKYPETI